MRIVTFIDNETTEGAPRVGALLDGSEYILDFASAIRSIGNGSDETDAWGAQANLLAWFDLEGERLKRAREVYDRVTNKAHSYEKAREEGLLIKRTTARLLAPVPRPGKLIAIGLNYRDHAAESNMPIPERPVAFSKFTTSVIVMDDPVILLRTREQLDYEVELGVVIGRRAKRVS